MNYLPYFLHISIRHTVYSFTFYPFFVTFNNQFTQLYNQLFHYSLKGLTDLFLRLFFVNKSKITTLFSSRFLLCLWMSWNGAEKIYTHPLVWCSSIDQWNSSARNKKNQTKTKRSIFSFNFEVFFRGFLEFLHFLSLFHRATDTQTPRGQVQANYNNHIKW